MQQSGSSRQRSQRTRQGPNRNRRHSSATASRVSCRTSQRPLTQTRPKRQRSDESTQNQQTKHSRAVSESEESDHSTDEDEDSEDSDTENSEKTWTKSFIHHGPCFQAPYERLPNKIQVLYDKKPIPLTAGSEEIAGFYAKLLNTRCKITETLRTNFFKSWRDQMTSSEKTRIKEFRKCDFRHLQKHFEEIAELRKTMSAQDKLEKRTRALDIRKTHGFCTVDGRVEGVANYTVEPPGIYMGRGDNPDTGKVKARIRPEDVTINSSRGDSPKPPQGHHWKGVIHNNARSWIARWENTITGKPTYVKLGCDSKQKRDTDMNKFNLARELDSNIGQIRKSYQRDWKSRDIAIRQRAVAMYFIDEFALRAGYEKTEEQAETFGCCSLLKQHLKLHDRKNGEKWVMELDFLGKDSIRYQNEAALPVEVYESLKSFTKGKRERDEIFDQLDTVSLNSHLSTLMPGLSAKVFRTHKASLTFERELDRLTPLNGSLEERLAAFTQANRAVAVLCNHKRTVPKSFTNSIKTLESKIEQKRSDLSVTRRELKQLKKGTSAHDKKQDQVERQEAALKQLQVKKAEKESGKELALGTSKTNYLDPRITVAWCQKFGVNVERVYSRTLRTKFSWAIEGKDAQKFGFETLS